MSSQEMSVVDKIEQKSAERRQDRKRAQDKKKEQAGADRERDQAGRRDVQGVYDRVKVCLKSECL